MTEGCRTLCFRTKPTGSGRVGQVLAQHLDSDTPAERAVPGNVHGAHSATTDAPRQRVAVVEHLRQRRVNESASVVRAGRGAGRKAEATHRTLLESGCRVAPCALRQGVADCGEQIFVLHAVRLLGSPGPQSEERLVASGARADGHDQFNAVVAYPV